MRVTERGGDASCAGASTSKSAFAARIRVCRQCQSTDLPTFPTSAA